MVESVTDEELLKDLKRVAKELSESPTTDQYKTHGKYTPWKLRSRFGSWSDAKKEAGLGLNRSGSTYHTNKEDLIRDIQRVGKKIGGSPTGAQYKDEGEYSIGTLKRQFGSWNEAKEQAGFETFSQSNIGYSDEELLDDLKKFANECDGSPTILQYREREGPDPDTIVDHFGSWNEAKERAGLKQNSRHESKSYDNKQELLDDLKNVAEVLDESPSMNQYRNHGEYSPTSFQNEFGSWNNAKEQAGLDIYPPDKLVPAEELIRDLQRTADRLGTSPSKTQYDEWGVYSHTICQNRFGSWNDALMTANIEVNVEIDIPEERIIEDIQNVASIVDETPTTDDYRNHGEHSLGPVFRHFGSWIDALTAAGYDWVPYEYSDEELLKSLRDISDNEYAPRRSKYGEEWTHGNIKRRFGSWWAGCVQAGLLPRNRRPLSPRAIHEYHQAAVSLEPHYGTYALLLQFTGMPSRIIENFSADWVADRERRNIIRVPYEETKAGKPWLFEYPDTWLNPYTGDREPTELPETLDWFTSNYERVPRNRTTFPQIVKRVASKGGLEDHRRMIYHTNIGYIPDVSPTDLRMTQGVNLVEQGVEKEKIRQRLGIEESKWGGKVEDCYLWAYIHRDIQPQNYDPPDVFLDPVEHPR